jgi:hypothetical protein
LELGRGFGWIGCSSVVTARGNRDEREKKSRCNYVYVTVLTSNYVGLDFFFALCLDGVRFICFIK